MPQQPCLFLIPALEPLGQRMRLLGQKKPLIWGDARCFSAALSLLTTSTSAL